MASISFLALFIVAHISEAGPLPNLSEWCLLMFFPGGVLFGLLLGLCYPAIGSLTSIGSLIAFYSIHFLQAGDVPQGPFFVVFTAPALLLAFDAWFRYRLLRGDHSMSLESDSRSNP